MEQEQLFGPDSARKPKLEEDEWSLQVAILPLQGLLKTLQGKSSSPHGGLITLSHARLIALDIPSTALTEPKRRCFRSNRTSVLCRRTYKVALGQSPVRMGSRPRTRILGYSSLSLSHVKNPFAPSVAASIQV
jgi:hypothetical protein